MKKLLVLALGFALMACTAPVDMDDEASEEAVPAVETEATMPEEAATTEKAAVVEETAATTEEAVQKEAVAE